MSEKNSRILKPLLWLSIIFIFGFLTYSYTDNLQNKEILIENKASKQDAKLRVVTFGERIESDVIYFTQWETLSFAERKDVASNEQIFMFSPDEFMKDSNKKLIHKLLADKKTVLFQGYKIDVESILGEADIDIPYFEINSNKHLYFYLYGSSYSEEQDKAIPVLLLGNFPSATMDVNVTNFLIKNYSK